MQSLSGPWCAERDRGALSSIIADDISFLFGNEDEIASLHQSSSQDAIADLAGKIDELVVTRGPAGAFIGAGAHHHEIPAMPQGPVIDTTGAGDLFAAGYLFARTNGFDLLKSGRLARLAAGEVISPIGARPQTDLKQLAANF